jgi:biopolymer transport protein ExbD
MHGHAHEDQSTVERSERRAPQVDMTPMIDCVFLLIIFFMLATTFAPLPGMRVKLPPTAPGRTNDPALTLRISNPVAGQREGVMVLNSEIVSLDSAYTTFMNLPADGKAVLTIQSGRHVMHDQIVQVMDRAKRAGVGRIGFAKVAQ